MSLNSSDLKIKNSCSPPYFGILNSKVIEEMIKSSSITSLMKWVNVHNNFHFK